LWSEFDHMPWWSNDAGSDERPFSLRNKEDVYARKTRIFTCVTRIFLAFVT